jgi:hypothetical protein
MRTGPALLLILAVLSAPADEITLVDGRVLEGEITSTPGADEVVLRQRSGSMTAIQRFPKAQVAGVRHGATERQQALAALAAKAKSLGEGGTASAWWSLVEAYRKAGEPAEAKRCAQVVIERDTDHADARALLGWVRHEGVWMRPNEAALARGEILFRGRWMPAAERDAVLAEEARAAAEAKTRAEERLADARRRSEEARLREAAAPEPSPWFVNGTWTPTPRVVFVPVGTMGSPLLPCPTVKPQPTLQIQASGQKGGTQWKLDYQR